MDVFSDIARVQDRISEISGSRPSLETVPEALRPAIKAENQRFAQMVAEAMARGKTLDAELAGGGAGRAPNPVPPAEIERLVEDNATQYQVDPALVKAIIANESGFNANATSNVGAQGLMQLMPGTAAGLGVSNAYDPAQNVSGGTRYIKGLLDRFGGDVTRAVAAYNAGPGAVEKYGGIPPYAETQNYVTNVLDSYRKYRGGTPPPAPPHRDLP